MINKILARYSLSVLMTVFLLAGCNKHAIDIEKLSNKTAVELYNIGNNYKNKRKYEDAVLAFEEVSSQHPYSQYVAESQLEAGKCYFKIKKYEEAVAVLETFIQTHITHEKVPEALYILGDIYFAQMPIVQRDQSITCQALEYFQELCINYPKSEYASRAKEKIKVLLQHLANHELKIGLYYQKLRNYTAAISRYNTIIESYGTTEIAEEAYHRLVECYLSLELIDEALAVNIVLQKKHKNSKWAKYSNDLISKYSNNQVSNNNKIKKDIKKK